MQVALNVPAEESSLTFGDLELKNDLSAVRNYSLPLLIKNFMRISSSSERISVVIIGNTNQAYKTKQLVKDIIKGIKRGASPIPIHGGCGGVYSFRNSRGENIAIVKPTDEEPYASNNPKGFVGQSVVSVKRSVRVGETGYREVAAYLLDYNHFANVPLTALLNISFSFFSVNGEMTSNRTAEMKQVSKLASFQQFIPHGFDASDYGTKIFTVASVHRIGILDIRILNMDRHAGNFLFQKLDGDGGFGLVDLIPIDHGFCLPENLEHPKFEWVYWPQASVPFSEDELEYIKNLDPIKDSKMLRKELPMIREACLRVMVLCTNFLKEAAVFGLSLADIGEMMSRKLKSREEEPSELQLICIEARKMIAEKDVFFQEVDAEGNHLAGSSSGNMRPNEQLAGGTCFVKVMDMNEEGWELFLEKFQELLYPAFTNRKSSGNA